MKFLGLIAAGHALVAALALCPGEVRAQAGSPVFSVPDRVEVEEGDVGYTDVVIAWSLSAPAAQDVAFTWYSASSELGPTPGIDYVAIPPVRGHRRPPGRPDPDRGAARNPHRRRQCRAAADAGV